jgi:hypothetical protein
MSAVRGVALMSLEGLAAVLFLLGAGIVLFALLKNSGTSRTDEEAAHLVRLLELIDSGSAKINLVSGDPPIALLDQERAVLVMPKCMLWEPKAVRISRGGYGGTSFRIAKGFWVHTGRSRSSSQSFDKLQPTDQGTLVVTNKRIAFLGTLKTICVELNSIISIDPYADGIGIHLRNKQKVECFHVASGIKLSWTEDDQRITVPFGGRVLEHVVKKAMRREAVALEGAH